MAARTRCCPNPEPKAAASFPRSGVVRNPPPRRHRRKSRGPPARWCRETFRRISPSRTPAPPGNLHPRRKSPDRTNPGFRHTPSWDRGALRWNRPPVRMTPARCSRDRHRTRSRWSRLIRAAGRWCSRPPRPHRLTPTPETSRCGPAGCLPADRIGEFHNRCPDRMRGAPAIQTYHPPRSN
jgi:hypothetical protein